MKNIHHALAASSNELTACLCATCNMRDRLLWYSWVHVALRPVISRAVSAFNCKRHTKAYVGVQRHSSGHSSTYRDRETWRPATAGATLIFAFISCVLFRAATLPLSNVGGSSYRDCCVLDKSVSDQSVWPANTVKCNTVKCNKHYMHVSHTVTPPFSGLSSCCTFLSFHIPLLPLLTIFPSVPSSWFQGRSKILRLILEKAVVKLDCDNPRQLSKSTT
jgi:hypothetical protein